VNPTWDPTADFIKFYLAANGNAVAWFSIASVPTSVANSFSFNGTLLVPLDATSTYQFGLTIVGAPVYASNSGLSVSTIKLLS
jgi:hypothetical protein